MFFKKFKVGDKVRYVDGVYHYDSYGSEPTGYQYRNMPVYVTKVNKFGLYPYHISTENQLGCGDLGWVKAKQLVKEC